MRIFILVLLALIFFLRVGAQDKEPQKAFWNINVSLAHFDREKKNELNLGDIGYNINPGMEIIYHYELSGGFYIKTGVSYQYMKLISHIETSDKFEVGELSIPVLISIKNRAGFSITSGVYAGQFLHFSWEKNIGSQWVSVNTKGREHYSDKSFFMDAYLGMSYANPKWSENSHAIKISPFVRVRFKENWMDYYRTSLYYGIKFGITLNSKTN